MKVIGHLGKKSSEVHDNLDTKCWIKVLPLAMRKKIARGGSQGTVDGPPVKEKKKKTRGTDRKGEYHSSA